jgi:hypothetical protein
MARLKGKWNGTENGTKATVGRGEAEREEIQAGEV